MDNIQQDHKAAITRYYMTLNVDKALKKQLVNSVHPMYTSVLCTPLMGFTNVPSLTIVQHLYQNYGCASPVMLAEADNKLCNEFDPSLPIEVLLTCIDAIQDLASASNNTYTDAQLINIAYNLIFSTGVHNDACKEWLQLMPGARTWATFKPHFTEAHCLLHKMQTLAVRAGYTANNLYVEEVQGTAAEALAQLAEATSSDRSAVADLTAANSNLMEQVANMSTQLTNKDTENAALSVSIENLNLTLQQLTSARITTTSTPGVPGATGVTGARKPRKKQGGVNISYC
eukprot:8197562-Ditylum_brightwellii.AAC.1